MSNSEQNAASTHRLYAVELDETSIGQNRPEVRHEREVAVLDLLEINSFRIEGRDDGPYSLNLSIAEDRLVFAVGHERSDGVFTFMLSLAPLRRVLKDYFIVCDSYYQAIRTAPPSRIQAIDMGRRSLHDEGSQLLMRRLDGKITIDFETARRLFTLIGALHWKG